MKKDEILDLLKKDEQFLKDVYGVESIALFGSYAKGLEKVSSDIDLFVEFKFPDYSTLIGISTYLENKLNSKIDIVRKGPHLSRKFINYIKKDLIYVG